MIKIPGGAGENPDSRQGSTPWRHAREFVTTAIISVDLLGEESPLEGRKAT